MAHEAEIKELLIGNAISLIAEGGFEKATTKNLTYYSGNLPDFKMNEVYIYRLFESKEGLYEAAFLRLDYELFRLIHKEQQSLVSSCKDSGVQAKLYGFFQKIWNFVVGNEDRCRCYVRYYYSVYFRGSSRDAHNRLFEQVIADVKVFFKEEADARSILHSVFITLLDFAIRVHNGELTDADDYRPHVFNVLYCMMQTYFREDLRIL